ncbi:chitinase [Arthroderma uncinatum]|uniref:chitinase n=1 Tax=Arthroderma uncinatum TaxID=74035 RepID=UPI00144AC31E|nr:chitinase [Arthroderma uncinatum]KAF3491741.1 chitinase [Arthroderma uncinatum]
MQRIFSIKLIQPDIKIWIAVGGWAFNDPGPTASIFSDLAASESKQEVFFDSVVKFMNTFGFDGIDIDWEYPVDQDRGGRPDDFKNFVSFIKNLKKRMSADGQTRGVSLTLPSSYWYLKHFDIVSLEKHVDWFNLMSYDIHGPWDIGKKWTGSFLNSHTNMTEIQDALDLLWRNYIHPDKVVLGVAFYSRSFTMESPGCTEPKCGALSDGIAGKCSRTTGVLLNPEIQDIIKAKGLTPKLHRKEAVKSVSWDNQWVSFDDEVTWRMKLNTARAQCISNVMVWAISQDDDKDTHANALIKASGREIRAWPDFSAQLSTESPSKATVVRLCSPYSAVPEIWTSPSVVGGDIETQELASLVVKREKWKSAPWLRAAQRNTKVHVASKALPLRPLMIANGMARPQFARDQGNMLIVAKNFPISLSLQVLALAGSRLAARKATDHTGSSTICEPSCPEGHIRLAIHVGDCKIGKQAYCCKGKPPPRLEHRGISDIIFAEGEIKEFRSLLKDYVKNPTCPAKMHPQLHDLPKMLPFRLIWTSEFVIHFDDVLETLSLILLLRSRYLDSRSLAKRVLYDPQNTAAGIKRDRRIAEIICERTTRGTSSSKKAEPALEARSITLWGRIPGVPYITDVLRAINDGVLPLHYARWVWSHGTSSNSPPGPFLELAYWIGRTPGVPDPNTELNIYRDTEAAVGDRWVVFHLHIDPVSEVLRNVGGRTYIGTPHITVFHAQHYRGNGPGWRVDGRRMGYENTRDGFNCPQEGVDSAVWYIGVTHDTTGLTGADEDFYRELYIWGIGLFYDGYAGSLGVSAIMQGGNTLANGDIDPDNYGSIIPEDGRSAVFDNHNPYDINFLIQDDEFVVEYPPPSHDEL